MIFESDLLAIAELVAKAGNVEVDFPTRKRLLLDGLIDLLKADCWIYARYRRDAGGGGLSVVSCRRGGDVNLAELLKPVWFSCPFLRRLTPGRDITALRGSVVGEQEWRSVEPWLAAYKALGLNDFIVSRTQISPRLTAELVVHRSAQRPAFEDRDRVAIHAINTRVRWLHKAAASKPRANAKRNDIPEWDRISASAAHLPERQRQILKELLNGESPKRIATHLDLTSSTVRTYIKHLYRRLSVNTRGELLSKFITQAPAEDLASEDLVTSD